MARRRPRYSSPPCMRLTVLRPCARRCASSPATSGSPGCPVRARSSRSSTASASPRVDHNPTALLADLDDASLAAAVTPEYLERVERVLAELRAERERRTWWQRREEDDAHSRSPISRASSGSTRACRSTPAASGVLAGDHLKSASDLGVPLVGVGLFYREGYFRQQLDDERLAGRALSGDRPGRLPLELESACGLGRDRGRRRARSSPVRAQVWRAQVGRVPLYLLDTDVDGNPDWARTITDRLYGGDRRHRLRQELVLGLGGVRALRALGVEPTVFHMNEGHSAFFQLERLRELVEEQGLSRDNAMARLRASTVFTTHTPVPAGNEIFDPSLVEQNIAPLVARCGFSWDEFVALGRVGRRRRLVRHDAVRAPHVVACERRLRAARRGVALDVARALARPAGRERADRLGHERRPRAHVDLRGARRAARHRRGHGHARLRACVRPRRRGALARAAARARGAPRLHALARPARLVRPGGADDRLRAALRDLQARRPASSATRRVSPGSSPTTSGRCRSCSPARRTRPTRAARR